MPSALSRIGVVIEAIKIVLGNRRAERQHIVNDRAGSARVESLPAAIANIHAGATFPLKGRPPGDHVDCTAKGVASAEQRLRPFNHFHAFDIE